MKKTLLTLTALSALLTISVASDTVEYPRKAMSSNSFPVEGEDTGNQLNLMSAFSYLSKDGKEIKTIKTSTNDYKQPLAIDTTEQYQKLVKTLKDFEDSTSLEFGKFKVVKIDSSIYTATIYGIRFDICEGFIVNAYGKFATKKEVEEIDFVINLMIKLLEKERNI